MSFPRLFPPRPPVPRAGLVTCACRCHRSAEDGPAPTINGMCPPGVPRDDAIGAASACPVCLRWHCVALSGRPAELDARPRRPWNPPSLMEAVPQADGECDAD